MKILFRKWETEELEIEIRNQERDDDVKDLEKFLKGFERYLIGELEQYQHKIPLRNIYYLESVDKKVFFYTEHNVYRIQERLVKIEQDLYGGDFVRVSKNCLLNIQYLRQIKSLSNSRMEAVLSNKEKIIVSRNYLSDVRKALEQKGQKI